MNVRWSEIDRRSATNRSKKRAVKSIERKPDRGRDEYAAQSDLCRAISPIYYLGKACGLIPVRFIARASGRYQARLSILDLIYSLCVLTLLLGAEIWGLWRDMKDGWEHSTRLKSRTAVIATCSDVLGVMSLTVVCIVGSPFRWKYLEVAINKLIEVDERLGVPAGRKTRLFTICLTVCSLAYLWFNSILDFSTWTRHTKISRPLTDKGPINYAPLYFMYTVIISTELQYSVSTYNLSQRFVRLNNSLRNLLDSGILSSVVYSSANPIETVVTADVHDRRLNIVSGRQLELGNHRVLGNSGQRKSLIRVSVYSISMLIAESGIPELILIHSLLCDTVSLINNTFGVVILAVTTTCLLHLVITPYFLILQAGEEHEWIFLAVQGMWCIFHVTRMLIIVQPSYSTVAEAKKTAVLVSQLLSSSFDASTRHQLEIFSLQLLHRPLEFSVCGLFSLDRTLITSITGAVTTYLVILIQFQNADDTQGQVDRLKNATQILKNASTLQNLAGMKTVL
nr:gustatory receptor for sugar taste 43a-like isoform X1 [Megalopta genalis]XP_033337493.1 gustatory receptor for sugar taste 43a-like isoform X1 [Megalopta genalis]